MGHSRQQLKAAIGRDSNSHSCQHPTAPFGFHNSMYRLSSNWVMAQEKDQNFIERICRRTANHQLCISTLKADPKSTNADVIGLSLIMVNAVKAKAEETKNTINKLKRSRKDLRAALNDCSDCYNAILKAGVPVAIAALTLGDSKFAEDGTADSVIEAETCEENFKLSMSPLTGLNKAVGDLSSVVRAIIRNLL